MTPADVYHGRRPQILARRDPPVEARHHGWLRVTPDDPQYRVIFGSHVVENRPIVLVNSVESLH